MHGNMNVKKKMVTHYSIGALYLSSVMCNNYNYVKCLSTLLKF